MHPPALPIHLTLSPQLCDARFVDTVALLFIVGLAILLTWALAVATSRGRVMERLEDATGARDSDLIHGVRVAVSGRAAGPGLFEMLEVMGRDRVMSRLRRPPASPA